VQLKGPFFSSKHQFEVGVTHQTSTKEAIVNDFFVKRSTIPDCGC